MKDLFYCYSKRLSNYLNIFGFVYVKHSNSASTGREYWAYKKSEDLNFALNNWAIMKEHFDKDNKAIKKTSGEDN